jgi:hypothetical protein
MRAVGRAIMAVARCVDTLLFAVSFLLLALPVFLYNCTIDFVEHRVEEKWPDSDRMKAFRMWFPLLVPLVLLIGMLVAFAFAIAHLRARGYG